MSAASLPARLRYWFGYELIGRKALQLQRLQDLRKFHQRTRATDCIHPLKALVDAKHLLSRHYLEGHFATGVKKVAWVTSGAPTEILRALDFFLIYPENHAAICGARKMAPEICEEAEHAGYSRDICSYARTDIGTLLSGKTPVGRLPRPDLLVCCTNICQTVLYWYKQLAAYFKVPLFVVDTPFLYESWEPHQLAYVKRQLEDLIATAERVAGRTLPPKAFEQVMHRAKDATELWLQILDCGKARPSPISAFDEYILMAPIVDLRGDAATVDFYAGVLAELQQRMAGRSGAVEPERYRVLWDNLPIWYRIGPMSKLLAGHGVCMVASTYTYAWGEIAPLLDVSNPLDSMARAYLYPILNRSSGQKLEAMRRLVREFAVDGVLLHSDKSCKPYSLGQIDQRDRISGDLGVPALLLQADHNDARAYSDEQGRTRIEAFIEMMEAA